MAPPKRQRRSVIDQKNGLSLQENQLLAEIALEQSWQRAADNLGIARPTVRALFRRPEFKEAYDKLFISPEELSITKREIDISASDIAVILNEAKTAESYKHVTVQCPSCGTKWKETVMVPFWNARLKAVEMLAKMTALLKDSKSVEHSGQVNIIQIQLTAPELMALDRLRMGFPIPAHIYAKLEDWAAQTNYTLPALPEGTNMITSNVEEANFRELEDGKE